MVLIFYFLSPEYHLEMKWKREFQKKILRSKSNQLQTEMWEVPSGAALPKHWRIKATKSDCLAHLEIWPSRNQWVKSLPLLHVSQRTRFKSLDLPLSAHNYKLFDMKIRHPSCPPGSSSKSKSGPWGILREMSPIPMSSQQPRKPWGLHNKNWVWSHWWAAWSWK